MLPFDLDALANADDMDVIMSMVISMAPFLLSFIQTLYVLHGQRERVLTSLLLLLHAYAPHLAREIRVKSEDFFTRVFPSWNVLDFRRHVRMEKRTFFKLVALIEDEQAKSRGERT